LATVEFGSSNVRANSVKRLSSPGTFSLVSRVDGDDTITTENVMIFTFDYALRNKGRTEADQSESSINLDCTVDKIQHPVDSLFLAYNTYVAVKDYAGPIRALGMTFNLLKFDGFACKEGVI